MYACDNRDNKDCIFSASSLLERVKLLETKAHFSEIYLLPSPQEKKMNKKGSLLNFIKTSQGIK